MTDNSQSSNNKVVVPVPFSIKAFQEFRELARSLNVDLIDLIAQALYIIKMAQGRRLIIKEKGNDVDVWEIKNFRNQEPVLPLKGS